MSVNDPCQMPAILMAKFSATIAVVCKSMYVGNGRYAKSQSEMCCPNQPPYVLHAYYIYYTYAAILYSTSSSKHTISNPCTVIDLRSKVVSFYSNRRLKTHIQTSLPLPLIFGTDFGVLWTSRCTVINCVHISLCRIFRFQRLQTFNNICIHPFRNVCKD